MNQSSHSTGSLLLRVISAPVLFSVLPAMLFILGVALSIHGFTEIFEIYLFISAFGIVPYALSAPVAFWLVFRKWPRDQWILRLVILLISGLMVTFIACTLVLFTFDLSFNFDGVLGMTALSSTVGIPWTLTAFWFTRKIDLTPSQ